LIFEFNSFFERARVDCILYPTMVCLPPLLSDINTVEGTIPHNGRNVNQLLKSISNTDIASTCDAPCITIPVKNKLEGVAVGMEICGRNADDERVIAVAKEIEGILRE